MKYFLGLLAAVLLLNGLKDLIQGGAFRSIHPHHDGTCEKIPGVVGAEDMEYASDLNSLFISSDDRSGSTGEDGKIYKWDLSQKNSAPEVVPFKTPLGFRFHPHGVGLLEDHHGLTRLWVVNHRSGVDTSVEVFDYSAKENTLSLVVSEHSPLLKNGNDLIPVSPTSFYTTHDHEFLSLALKMLEDMSGWGRGYVTFTDASGTVVKTSGIPFPNGIALDASGEHLFVASTMREEIRVFERNVKTGDLKFEKKIPLNAAPDNLRMDSNGVLWVAAHPSILALTLHMKNPKRLAPSEVIRIENPLLKDEKIEEVFLDDGALISAASVAFAKDHRLILGSILGDHLLDCRSNRI
jgi:arylesterase/paraoxonase